MKRPDLLKAAINCPHQITEKSVILHFDEKAHGHNALQQLGNRLERELHTAYKSNDDLVVIRTAITDDKNDIEGLRSAIRVLTPNFQTWIGKVLDELVTLRAQADARPVWQIQGAPDSWLDVDEETWKWSDESRRRIVYTHPEASAPGLSDTEILKIAREAAPPFPWGIGTTSEIFLQAVRAILTRASAATVGGASDKLDEPAQVGNTVFRKGVEARLVVEAAQRNYQRIHSPTEEDKRIAAGVESLAQLRRQIAAEHDAKSPFQREVEKMGNRSCQGTADTCPNECSSPCQSQAAQQQAEQESVIKRQAQKIGELIADRDSWIEAHARLYRLYHDQSPRAGEEIHVNVEGGDVYTLPLQLSGMDKPRFVVHVPCSPQAEPGADERADAMYDMAFVRGMQMGWNFGENGAREDYDLALKARDGYVKVLRETRAAQSGQRSGVAEDANLLRDAAEKGLDINQQPQLGCVEVWAGKGDDALVFREYYSGHADREAATKCALKRALAAPTQQQEGGDV